MPEDLWSFVLVGDPQVSPDGEQVVFVVTETDEDADGYASSIWIAETKDPSTLRPLTNPPDDEPVRESLPRWSPDGFVIAFASNRDGATRLWVIDPEGGEAERISQHSGNIAGLNWSPLGDALTFTAAPAQREEDRPRADVYVTDRLRYKFNGRGLMDDSRRNAVWTVDLATGEVLQLTDAWWDDSSPTWSPDGEYIYFISDRYPEEDMYYVTDLWRVPATGGTAEKVSDGEGPITNPVFAPEGGEIAFVGHRRRDDTVANLELLVMGPGGEAPRSLTGDVDRSVGNSVGADVRFDGGNGDPRWIDGGSGILFSMTDGGHCNLYRIAADGSEATPRALEGLPPVVTSFSANASGDPVVALVGADWNTPGDLWVVDAAGRPLRFSHFNDDLLDEVKLSEPRRVTYRGADDWPMEGWIMEPLDRAEGERYPLVLEIHGGPAATSGAAFFLEYQLLTAAGWGVMFNNPRGSKGYGEEHARGVIGEWGKDDFIDLMAAADRALEMDWVDPDRLGVTGGSYGGYMTNWMVTQTDRFRAAATFRSISNLYTKYGCSDIGFYHNRKGMGGADLWDSEDFIMSRSPIRYAPNVKTPILIVHSEEDHRCPMEQGEQWFSALKRLGVTCRFVRYAGENHELSRAGRPHNRVDRLHRLLDWFHTYLD